MAFEIMSLVICALSLLADSLLGDWKAVSWEVAAAIWIVMAGIYRRRAEKAERRHLLND